MLYAIPNGGARHIAVAAKLKADGVRSGVPDLALACARGQYNGLYIELKTMKGVTSPQQKEWIEKLKRYGYQAIVCKGWDAARVAIEDYLDQ